MTRRVLGEEHPTTLTAMYHLGWTHHYRGNLKESVEMQEEALKKSRRIMGENG
jgi:hypothetical protein